MQISYFQGLLEDASESVYNPTPATPGKNGEPFPRPHPGD